MMKGQLHEEQNDTYEAQQAYRSGVWLFFHPFLVVVSQVGVLYSFQDHLDFIFQSSSKVRSPNTLDRRHDSVYILRKL